MTVPTPDEVVADPKRPYKAYAVMVIVALSTLVSQDLPLNIWVKAGILCVIAGLTTYVTPNPLKYK